MGTPDRAPRHIPLLCIIPLCTSRSAASLHRRRCPCHCTGGQRRPGDRTEYSPGL